MLLLLLGPTHHNHSLLGVTLHDHHSLTRTRDPHLGSHAHLLLLLCLLLLLKDHHTLLSLGSHLHTRGWARHTGSHGHSLHTHLRAALRAPGAHHLLLLLLLLHHHLLLLGSTGVSPWG